jgi:hypothetical protein
MSKAYYPQECKLSNVTVIGASQTNTPISLTFSVSKAGSLNILVAIQCSAVTAGAGITAKLQSSVTGADWLDGNSVSVTGNGWFYIRMNIEVSADQAKLPLADLGRVVLTTGAGSAATIDAVYVVQAH